MLVGVGRLSVFLWLVFSSGILIGEGLRFRGPSSGFKLSGSMFLVAIGRSDACDRWHSIVAVDGDS